LLLSAETQVQDGEEVMSENLNFNKTDESIIKDFEAYFDMILTSLNDMS
jgi:hypothetical protein